MLGKTNAVSGGKQKVDKLQLWIDETKSCNYMFYYYNGGDEVMAEMLQGLDTSNATNMKYMFANCEYLTSLDLSNFNTSNVTDMYFMFQSCTRLLNIDLSNFDTSKVANMSYMFSNCDTITTLDLSSFNTSNVTNMSYMFYSCDNLATLNLSNFNMSRVTSASDMFYSCPKLTYLNLNNWDTSTIVAIGGFFRNCFTLSIVDGAIDLYSATSISNMFDKTYALTGVTLKNIRKSLQIGSGTSYGHLWELAYLVNAVKELWDLSESDQQTLTIGSANLEKIANTYVKLITPTAEQIEADPYINNKLPCEVCESTDEGAMTLTAYAGLKNWVLA